MIIGTHALVYTKDAERTRAFFRDVLGFHGVDAGEGWLIFRLPPAEVGIHPDEKGGWHELYFMCDDVKKTVADLRRKGVAITKPITDYGYGLVTAFRLPDGEEFGLYEPKHPMAIDLPAAKRSKAAKAAPKRRAKPRARKR
jgi:catechol 2,3-dioxygenase-like lactoylglutathione lyase family enzyme